MAALDHFVAFNRIYGGMRIRGIGVTSSGQPYYVFGGPVEYLGQFSSHNDPQRGLLVLEFQPKDPCAPATIDENGPGNAPMSDYETPSRAGPIVNFTGLGDSIGVITSTGKKFTFSVTQKAFVNSP